ncbi:MAG: DUF21 domain-containing protein [Elusimicrobia bacterium]|nr:DUF21 domain-containing protein [Elusimicrobiota bacterium]
MDYINFFASVIFLLLNAFFALIEYAIVRSRATKFQELALKGSKNARIALDITDNIKPYLASIQLAITVASIGLGWIAQPFVARILNTLFYAIPLDILKLYSYPVSIGVAFLVVTSLQMIVGEQVPKYIALSKAETIILFFALPLKIFYKLTYYPMIIINSSSEFIVRLLGLKKQNDDDRIPSEDEMKLILSQSEELGRLSLQRLLMFDHLFDFGKTSVKEIMTPSEKIVFVDINSSFEDIIDTLSKFKFSRYPVKENGRYTGYIHIKDIVLNYKTFKSDGFKLSSFMKEIKSLKEKVPVERALKYFQENQLQISLVENENKEVVGFLSVEDIVEDLVGEIRDEFEKRPAYRLDAILDRGASIISLSSNDRFAAIDEMIDKLYKSGLITDKYEIRDKIIKREKSFSTAIGHQVAIPHARIDGLKKPIMTVGVHQNEIFFPSPDNRNVKIIFMILTPYNDPSIQLNILSKISKLISNVTLRRKLFKSKSIDEVLEVLTTFEDSMPLD